jgi:hypothetical protein
MIELCRDCIWLAQGDGEAIPCSVDDLVFDVVGSGSSKIGPEVLRHAAAGVLHYFKEELGRMRITLGEFAGALARVLTGLGYTVEVTGAEFSTGLPGGKPALVRTADLRVLASASGKLGELEFFPRLHTLLRQQLADDPQAVEFLGLRGAVKQLLGRKHWTQECRELEDRILESLRSWWARESGNRPAALVVR